MLATRRNPTHSLSPFGDPFTAFDRMSRWFDDDLWSNGASGTIAPRIDLREDKKHFTLVAELPGLTTDDVDVTIEDGVLRIQGEKKSRRDESKDAYHVRERYYGTFVRSFRLPDYVDTDKIDAQLKDGLLTVTLNKTEAVLPRRIDVKVG